MFRKFFLLIGMAVLCLGQVQMTVNQLKTFIQSSKKLGYTDKKVAAYLKSVRLSERLDESSIEDLQAEGAGPKTLETLRELAAATKELPAPAAPPPKPVVMPIPPPDSVEQAKVLNEAREYALDYSKRLPNFICTQVTRRYADPSGLEFWQTEDTVVAKLTYFEQREDYKVVLVNDRMTDTTMEHLGGATSTGEFGSLLREIFAPDSNARFQWERWGTLRGHRMHVYSYRVEQQYSKWHVQYEKKLDTVPGYHGLVYVDRDTSAIMRITLEAELPLTFPVQQASTVLDYDVVEIAGSPYVLPLKAVVRMRAGKLLTKNEVDFRFYKRFGAEATVTFVPDAVPEDKEQPAK